MNGELLATAVTAFTLPGRTNKAKSMTNCRDDQQNRRKSYEIPLDGQADIYQLREYEHSAPSKDETSGSHTSSNVTSFRKDLYDLVGSRALEGFITFSIVTNTVVMATEHYGMSSTLENVISVSNYVSIESSILRVCKYKVFIISVRWSIY